MAEFKQFGDVVLNLDRVVKVEKTTAGTVVYLAGMLSRPAQDEKASEAMRKATGRDARPGTHLFVSDASIVWGYFSGRGGGKAAAHGSFDDPSPDAVGAVAT